MPGRSTSQILKQVKDLDISPENEMTTTQVVSGHMKSYAMELSVSGIQVGTQYVQ